jgi:Zinc finger, C3HC4 type (RING finger)
MALALDITQLTKQGRFYSDPNLEANHVDISRYIHANYRFIVNPRGNYHAQSIDADAPIEWANILQILASAESQTSSCPICLSHPVAPRMAKCGHIFCLPCLIRYMHSTDEAAPIPEKKARWKKCPICWDSVYMSDTKPVRWFTGQEGPPPRESDDVVLRLIMRQPGSTLALPRDGAEALGKSEDIPWYFAAEVTDYARVMKGSEDYMLAQYDTEIEELQRQEKEDELMFGEETEWTKKAVKAVNDAKERVKGVGNPPAMPKQPVEKKSRRPPIQFNSSSDDVPDMYYIQHALKSGQSSSGGVSTPLSSDPSLDETGPSPEIGLSTPSQPNDIAHQQATTQTISGEVHSPDSTYFFYQALLHYYLAPLDIRILKAAFGNFASFPTTVLPRVERVSTGHIVDDDLRKRAKYLAHLPYGCEVGFLECDWTDVVSSEILEQFKKDIERRQKKNKEKESREEKDRLRAEKEEDDKRWAAARRKRPDGDVPTTMSTESFSGADFQPLAPSSLDAANGAGGASPPWPSRQGSSFATLASPSSSPVPHRTVWGTALIPPLSPEVLPQQQVEQHDGDDGWLQDWEKELLAENEILAQVQALSLSENGNANGNGESGSTKVGLPSTGAGKKKKKKITLMSTTARRAA